MTPFKKLTPPSIRLISFGLLLFGASAVAFAFLVSYPVVLNSYTDTVFGAIHPVFWFGLSAIQVGLFLFSLGSNRKSIFLICSAVFLFSFWLIFLFFPLLPGSDSHYFRSATENFMKAGVNFQENSYFQWPVFFVLSSVIANVLGISVALTSIIVFVAIGVVISASLSLFFFMRDERLAFVGVVLYVVGAYSFLDYQFAPQSLALAFFVVLLLLMEKKGHLSTIAILLLFTILVFTHAFVPVFFLMLLLFITLKRKTVSSLGLLILCTSIYLSVLWFFQPIQLHSLVNALTSIFQPVGLAEYGTIVSSTLSAPISVLDNFAQTISRALTISIWVILALGFLGQFVRRKIRFEDFVLAAVGSLIFVAGIFLPVIGGRALQVVLIPLALGYLFFRKKLRKIALVFVFIILVLSPFVLVHRVQSVGYFQTISGQRATDFFAKTFRAENAGNFVLLASREDGQYLLGKLPQNSSLKVYSALPFGVRDTKGTKDYLTQMQTINSTSQYAISNIVFEKELVQSGVISYPELSQFDYNCSSMYNVVYCDGYSLGLVR